MSDCLWTKKLKPKAKKLQRDAKYHNQKLLQIVYKGKLIPWRYNEPQQIVWEARRKQEAAGKPIRIVTLKARREGISTLIEGWIYHKVTTRFNRVGMVISHEKDSANEIFEITRRFWNYQDPEFRPALPTQSAPRGREMFFHNLGSKLLVETALDVTAGRSMTIDYLHPSEVAFWRDPATVMLGLLQCVNDDDPDTMVIIESTANGEGGWFYDLVIGAQNGDNDYALVFLPWFIDSRYHMAVPAGMTFTADEEEIRRKYIWQGRKVNLTDEQLYWRRWRIRNKCGGDALLFQQEYPGSIEEAFIATGRKRFVRADVDRMASKAKKSIFRGFLRMTQADGKRTFKKEANENGQLRIYEMPIPKETYVIFADVAEGKIQTGNREPDFSTIGVMRCSTMEEIAVWHGRTVPEKLAEVFETMGYYYNTAYGSPEKNSIGYATVAKLKERNYPMLYIRMVEDKTNKIMLKEYGWETNSKTKPLMINDLAEALSNGDVLSSHSRTHMELRTFAVLDDGSLGAPAGMFDDCVIRLAGEIQMRKAFYSEPEPESTRKHDVLQDDDDFDEEDDE